MSEEEFLLGPSFFVSRDKAYNVDHLSHVASSNRLASSDRPKAQLVTLGYSPHNSTSKLRFLSPSEEKSRVLTF